MRGDDAVSDSGARFLRDQRAGSAAAHRAVSLQAEAAPRSALQRWFGSAPLRAAARPDYDRASGQIAVGAQLARLGRAWTTLHAVPIGSGDMGSDVGSSIDHVVIGPPGVIAVTSRSRPGARVVVSEFSLTVDGMPSDDLELASAARDRVEAVLGTSIATHVVVRSVLAIDQAADIDAIAATRSTEVLPAYDLVPWLSELPALLSSRDIAHLVAVADDPESWGAPPGPGEPGPDWSAFRALQQSVAQARRRRRGWRLAGIIVALVAAVVVYNTLLTAFMTRL